MLNRLAPRTLLPVGQGSPCRGYLVGGLSKRSMISFTAIEADRVSRSGTIHFTRPNSYRLLLSIALVAVTSLWLACATVDLTPLPRDSRVALLVTTTDETGTDTGSLFSNALRSCLLSDYVYATRLKSQSGATEVYEGRIAQNPFAVGSESTEVIRVSADLERVVYGPQGSAEAKALTAYLVGGVVGAWLGGVDDEDDYIAGLQLRFRVDGWPDIQPILVRVSSHADVQLTSRQDHLEAVSRDAANAFLYELAEQLSTRSSLSFKSTSVYGTPEGVQRQIGEVLGRLPSSQSTISHAPED